MLLCKVEYYNRLREPVVDRLHGLCLENWLRHIVDNVHFLGNIYQTTSIYASGYLGVVIACIYTYDLAHKSR